MFQPHYNPKYLQAVYPLIQLFQVLQAIEKAKALDFSVEESEKIQPEEGEQDTEDLGYRLILSKVNAPINIDEDTWDLIDIALDTHGNYDGWETPIIKE